MKLQVVKTFLLGSHLVANNQTTHLNNEVISQRSNHQTRLIDLTHRIWKWWLTCNKAFVSKCKAYRLPIMVSVKQMIEFLNTHLRWVCFLLKSCSAKIKGTYWKKDWKQHRHLHLCLPFVHPSIYNIACMNYSMLTQIYLYFQLQPSWFE